jgi:hypothetical protein
MTWIIVVAGAVLAILLLGMVYLAGVLGWEDQKTLGTGYYGLPRAERDRFKQALRRHARVLAPVFSVFSRLSKFQFEKTSFHHRGIAGPKGTCSKESFERADAYRAGPEDIFVATQMKCGTTWMLHVVYQVLLRGRGDLVESDSTLHAVCPWIEGRKTVSMENAPLVGTERPSRVIKTHLPAELCPFSPEARYIYVVRHPVSCFASCADFIAANSGRFAPPLDAVERWFLAEGQMWWGTWPTHVKGWWDLSRRHGNVLFVSFEEMKRDLAGIVRRVEAFLGVAPLTEDERAQVVAKCSFRYMQEHDETFEMHPPHILAVDAELFVRGSADRHKDVPKDTQDRIRRWSAAQLAGSDFPLAQYYPDVVAP